MIVAAAIRTESGDIYTDKRHYLILQKKPAGFFKGSEQGFVTSSGEFVDRVEAFRIAEANNQIINKHGSSSELYSEDIF